MELSVLTVPLYDRPVEEAFAWLSKRGVECVELGTGGFPGKGHCDPVILLADESKLEEFKALLSKYQLKISALSCHSNHVHPDPEVRKEAARDFTNTLKLAQKLDVSTVITFSGCPGDHKEATCPNWITYTWPPCYAETLDWQWNEVLIPFWREAVKEAASYGVAKIALELHPGFCVYNPASLLRLREAVGPAIGANLDPSHLFWQGIRPTEAIKVLGDAIYHFHAKDTNIDMANTAVNGVLDTNTLDKVAARSWLFRTVGFGHDQKEWRDIVSTLRMVGYDGAVSIEHEDALMSVEEGLSSAIEFLKPVLVHEKPIDVFWA